jgi:multiple sugar transport system permease protein
MSRRTLRNQAALHAALGAGAVIMLCPFAIMVVTSLLPERDILADTYNLHDLTFSNFTTAWSAADWPRYYANSTIVTSVILAGQIVTSIPAGYALARLSFRGRKVAFAILLIALVIPEQITAIPNFLTLSRVNLSDSLPGLFLPFIASAFGIFLFRQFILTIPQSVFDAARLDGVRPAAMLWHVVLPNVRPAILALGVFSVITHWNDLFWPSVILRTQAHYTVPYAIAQFANQENGGSYGAQMAAATLAVIPLIVVFIAAQRTFLRGLALTGGIE